MYKIIVIIRFHRIAFNNTSPVQSYTLWYFIIIVCEHLNSLQWPRCPGQAQAAAQTSVDGSFSVWPPADTGRQAVWPATVLILPRMRTPHSLHNPGWRGHWPPTGAVYSLCRSVTQFLVITASNGACTCMQPCPVLAGSYSKLSWCQMI